MAEEYDIWHCEKCDETFDHKELQNHLMKKHDCDATTGNRSMIMHVDGKDFYKWKYRWDIGGLEFIQETCNKRTGMDKRIWAGA